MASININVKLSDLALTKKAFFSLFDSLRGAGHGIKGSYEKIDDYCNEYGYHNYYSSFQSFKTAYYSREK